MSEGHVECPSGLVVEVRGLKTREANILGNRQAVKQGTVMDQILTGCTLRLVDPGPYSFSNGKVDWSKVHTGDRLFTILRIRAATFGEDYAFDVRCTERSCGERIKWVLKLCDLPVKPLPEAAREALRGDRILTTTLKGKQVRFRLITGADEEKNRRIIRAQPERLYLAALAARVVSIEGVADVDRMRWLEDLDLADTALLREKMDEQDGGVETDIEVECPACDTVQEVRLPFGPEFFLPKMTPRKTAAEPPEEGSATP